MDNKNKKIIRTFYDRELDKYFYSILDVIKIFKVDSNSTKEWDRIKQVINKENSRLLKKARLIRLKNKDNKYYFVELYDEQTILRIIMELNGKNSENIKCFLARLAQNYLNELRNPEKLLHRLIMYYQKMDKNNDYIKERIYYLVDNILEQSEYKKV